MDMVTFIATLCVAIAVVPFAVFTGCGLGEKKLRNLLVYIIGVAFTYGLMFMATFYPEIWVFAYISLFLSTVLLLIICTECILEWIFRVYDDVKSIKGQDTVMCPDEDQQRNDE